MFGIVVRGKGEEAARAAELRNLNLIETVVESPQFLNRYDHSSVLRKLI